MIPETPDVSPYEKAFVKVGGSNETMATFAKTTFDSARYSLFRPTYPRQLFDVVFRFHEQTRDARWDLAVDLGCGTGLFREY